MHENLVSFKIFTEKHDLCPMPPHLHYKRRPFIVKCDLEEVLATIYRLYCLDIRYILSIFAFHFCIASKIPVMSVVYLIQTNSFTGANKHSNRTQSANSKIVKIEKKTSGASWVILLRLCSSMGMVPKLKTNLAKCQRRITNDTCSAQSDITLNNASLTNQDSAF